MTYRVVIQPDAQAEIVEAFSYIHVRSPLNAERWLRGLYAAIETLGLFPTRCGLARENYAFRGQEIRQLLYGKGHHRRRILFTIRGEEVHVLHVRHGARR